jgi:hypothetical protein
MLCCLMFATGLSLALAGSDLGDAGDALQVIIMAGQSNTVGHGYAEGSNLHWNSSSSSCVGFPSSGCNNGDPSRPPPNLNGSLLTPEYSFLRTADKKWTQHKGVWVVFNETSDDCGLPGGFPTPGPNGGYWHGELSVGYGGFHKGLTIYNRTNRTEVGPEIGFGWALGDAYAKTGQQVLIIKTAWGGRTIDGDFRPPSSAAANKTGPPVGPYYTRMVAEVVDALSKLKTFFPSYSGSYELAGFVWHQGWNDACCSRAGVEPGVYEFDLANLIRDLRKDLEAPKMKAIVGTSGMCGFADAHKYPHNNGYQHCGDVCAKLADPVITAQLAVGNAGKYPEFAGNVASVELRGFHFDMEKSPGNQCYHWNNNAQSYWLGGQAMAKAFLALKQNDTTSQRVHHAAGVL